MSMLSRQSPGALRRAQLLRWPLNAATRRANSTEAPSSYSTEPPNPSETPSHAAPTPASQPTAYNRAGAESGIYFENKKIAKKVIFSGIQPTGVPHLGNYLGALQQWVKLQDEGHPTDQRFYSIVDLHAITSPQEPQRLLEQTRETYASLLAIGLDPKRSHIFAQQDVLHHTQLMWILSCHASMGYLARMTQWKSKTGMAENADPFESSAPNKPALKLGLFSYPVLQAADILLYNASHVPVGEDQAQHLEFTRELAKSINHSYAQRPGSSRGLGKFSGFRIPETIHSPAKRIMSLQEPTKKMSKSDPDKRSRILVTDSREEIENKIRRALTDSIPGVSYDRAARPGVSNLIDIMYYMDESKYASPEQIANDVFGPESTLKTLKDEVARTISDKLEPIRERYLEQMAGPPDNIDVEMVKGAHLPRTIAGVNLGKLKDAMGLHQRPPLKTFRKARLS